MNTSQFIIYSIIFLLLFNKASRTDAFILLLAYSIYQLKIVNLDAIYYYSCTSFLNLCVGLVLHHRNKCAAICSYSLIFVNLLGFFMWYQYLPPNIYDNISLFILIIQLITITPKGLLNGLGHYSKYFMAKSHGFDGNQTRVTMYKNQTRKKATK